MSGMNIVGVQFRRAGKIYDFDARDFRLSIGDRVVVDTERGPSLAEVKRVSYLEIDDVDPNVLKPITRIASRKDMDIAGRLSNEQAESFTKEKIKELDLDMRVIGVEIQFGGNKVIVYFSAPGRVDFRELVKELAGGLKTRVELKQVGSRDEAKLSGGLGICGREFCCSSFLREFVPVSIKMAKNQNLALNPSKVSGGCGRLLCCLTYEDETYSALRQQLLPKGARVRLPEGFLGDVIRGDILNQTMLVELDTGEQRSVPISELEVLEARQAASDDDDWGSDLDLNQLMGDGDIAALDDSDEVQRQRGDEPAAASRPRPSVSPRGSQQPRPEGRGSRDQQRAGRSDRGEPRRERGGERGNERQDRGDRQERVEGERKQIASPRQEPGAEGNRGDRNRGRNRGDRDRGKRNKDGRREEGPQGAQTAQAPQAPRPVQARPPLEAKGKPETSDGPKIKVLSPISPKKEGQGAGGASGDDNA